MAFFWCLPNKDSMQEPGRSGYRLEVPSCAREYLVPAKQQKITRR